MPGVPIIVLTANIEKEMQLEAMDTQRFASRLVTWQKECGRHGLPWMVRDPYARWLSEIMLQQTQVSVVIDYFARFTQAFPTVRDLAFADEEDVMQLWAGLGYYSRARNLHAAARMVMDTFHGSFPKTSQELECLPGVGRSTAAAIASFCFDEPVAILDGNVKRVLSRVIALDEAIDKSAGTRILWQYAQALVSRQEPGIYNQAMMDLGAMICTRTAPKCLHCPIGEFCRAHQLGKERSYPVKTPPKKRPERTCSMYVYRKGGNVWLVRRTQKGVWQGLWSLPEVAPADGGKVVQVSHFTHDFTHYRLQAHICEVHAAPQGEGRWVRCADIAQTALPTPVKKILLALYGG